MSSSTTSGSSVLPLVQVLGESDRGGLLGARWSCQRSTVEAKPRKQEVSSSNAQGNPGEKAEKKGREESPKARWSAIEGTGKAKEVRSEA